MENLDILLYCGFVVLLFFCCVKANVAAVLDERSFVRLLLLSAHLGRPIQEGADCVPQYSAKASYLAKQKSFFFFSIFFFQMCSHGDL